MKPVIVLIAVIFATILLVNYVQCVPVDSDAGDDSFAPLESEPVLSRQKRQFGGYGGYGGGGFGRGFGGGGYGGYGGRGFGGGFGGRGFGGGGYGGYGYGR